MASALIEPVEGVSLAPDERPWNYEDAFARNLGLVTTQEQQRLRRCRVAIAGMGGVGGVHLVTLARLGIGQFTIADLDTFDIANTNRQYGATVSNFGRAKTHVMATVLRDINPEADLRVIDDRVSTKNAEEFLAGADLFVDGLDFFAIHERRALFRLAAKKGIYAVTAAPLGFSTAWLIFAPGGMSFDQYFDLTDDQDEIDLLAGFAVGLAPRATHLSYMDLSRVNLRSGAAPSCGAACHLAAGVIGIEAMKLLVGRTPIRPAPYYHQFDVYRGCYRCGRLKRGNRGALQRLKRKWLAKRFRPAIGGRLSGLP